MTTETNFHEYLSLMQRAQALMDINRWDEAIKLLAQGLSAYPDDHWLLCSMSLSHLNRGDEKRALEYADNAIRCAPEEEWGYRLRSLILGRMKRKEESLEAAREAVRLAPQQPESLYILTIALINSGLHGEARTTAEKMRQVAPEAEIAHEALGNVALEQKRWSDAEDHFEEALRINPNSYEAMNNLGVALLNQDRQDEAAERFQQAAAINPRDETARANLKAAVRKFLPLTGVAVLLLLKAFSLKAPFLFAWFTLHTSRLFFQKDVSWGVILGGLLALVATIFYAVMVFHGISSLRSSRFKHLPERLQNYIHLERSRSWHGFIYTAVGGASLVVLMWWGLFWWDDPQGKYAPQTFTSWLTFLILCATTVTSSVQLWRNHQRTARR